jgi:hypothetical protein
VGQEDRTAVIYHAQFKPNFFIPPLVGSYYVKKKLRKSVLTSMARIECIARIQAGLEPNPVLKPLLLADEQTGSKSMGAALQAGEDPTLIARAPAAGGAVSETTDCTKPCRSKDPSCRP